MSRDRLLACFTTILSLPADIDSSDIKYRKTEGWDSIAHMQLIAEIESTFDIMLDTTHVIDMSSFDKACEILRAYDIACDD